MQEFHTRGYLPHYQNGFLFQHVIFRLADSLPLDVLNQMLLDLNKLPESQREQAKQIKIEKWIDSGYGSCVLRDPMIASMVQNALLYFEGDRYHLHAWCVMPNHVHVLVEPLNQCEIRKIVASWKKFTARKIKQHMLNANQEIGGPESRVWHREYWDRFMRDEDHYSKTIEYIEHNPVKSGLVDRIDLWKWSSAYSTE